MNVNFDIVLNQLDGEPLQENGKEIMVKTVAINALILMRDEDMDMSGEEKLKRYQLATMIHKGG